MEIVPRVGGLSRVGFGGVDYIKQRNTHPCESEILVPLVPVLGKFWWRVIG